MAVDPYAAIRQLPSEWTQEAMNAWYDSLRPFGFQSKYNKIVERRNDQGERVIHVELQQPGGHKYDTMIAEYKEQPDGSWQLANDPMQALTRQESSSSRYDPRNRVRDDLIAAGVSERIASGLTRGPTSSAALAVNDIARGLRSAGVNGDDFFGRLNREVLRNSEKDIRYEERGASRAALIAGAIYGGGALMGGEAAGGGAGGTAAGLGEGSGAWLGGADAAAGGLSAAEAGAVGGTAGGTAGGGLGGGGFMDPTAFSGYGGNLSMANAGGGFGPGGFGASLGNIGGSAAPAATGGGMWQNLLVQAGSTLASSAIQSRAAGKAAGAQAAASQAAVDEQRRQFDELQKLLAPYVQAGTPALQQLQAIAGTAGPEAQQAAIAQIEQSPFFQSSVRQGEEAMLQRASATGGLRGGNIQGALAQFRPAMLQNAIEQQYARLSGLTTLGQQSAARVGASGMQTGTNIGELLLRGGAAQAGGIIGQAAPWAQFANLPGQYAAFQTGRGVNVFGGTQPTMQPNQAPGISPGGYTGFEFGGP